MAPILETRNLVKYFKTNNGLLHAVDNVSFSIEKGKTLGVVGESGCGKSTLGRTILRLIEPTSGEIFYCGENILAHSTKEMLTIRKKIQIIFQDPYSSINPRMTVSQLIEDPLKVIQMTKSHRAEKIGQLMELVGLDKRYERTYPHELDGGRRQRIGIARAMSLDPEIIVCDEPVSALDVSIQAQILNLLMDLQEQQGLTYMFITHDLSVVRHISDEIIVMYLGVVVEQAQAKELFTNPLHPYTKELIKSIPIPDLKPEHRLSNSLRGEVSDPVNPPAQCRFASRCNYCVETCLKSAPPLKEIDSGHYVACVLYQN